jgi:uncharacterized protein YtpQ (UPF0354 family)
MGIIDILFGPPSRDKFANLVLDGLRRAGEQREIVYDREQFCLRVEGDHGQTANLVNLYREFCSVPREQREMVIRTTVRSWFLSGKDLPEAYEDACYDLLPTIRSRAFIEFTLLQLSNDGNRLPNWPYQIIGEHLALGLVYDLPQAMRSISQEDLDRWEVSFYEALEKARDNLAHLGEQVFVGIADRTYVSATGDNYDASRLILLDAVRQLTVQGDHVAMVPNRDTLIITGTDDEEGLGMMASLAEEAFRKPRPMTAIAFRLEGEEWTPWQPGRASPAYKPFQALRTQSLGQEYNDQKELLEKQLERQQEDVFIASFMGMRQSATSELISFCSWAEGLPTLLPRTDRIAFVREGSEPILVDWSKAEQVVGHLITPQDLYPERVRVDDFPSPDEIARLQALAER